jgi:signal transduction histidine kinase
MTRNACWQTPLMKIAKAHDLAGQPQLLQVFNWLIVCLFFASTWGCSQAPDDAATVHVTGAQLLSVAGKAYTAPPANLRDAQLPSAGWQTVALPYIAPRELVPQSLGETRTVTDWVQMDLSQLQASAAPGYVYLPRWKTIGQIAIYGDGELLYRSEGSMTHNGYNHPLLVRLNPGAGERLPKAVYLRIDRLQSSGSALSTVWAGAAQSLVWRYQVRQFLQTQLPFIGGAAFLAVGLFSLAVWLRFRRDSLYLLFFAASALAFIRMLHYHIGGNVLPIDDEWFEWITVASLIWLIVLIHSFLERLHKRPLRWLTRTLVILTVLINLLTMPGASTSMPALTLFTPLLYVLLLPFALVIFTEALRNAMRTRQREVWLMAGWFFITTLCCYYDLALQNNWVSPEGMYSNPYAIIGLFAMFVYIMFRRYVGAINEVELANANLAQRLQSREAELAESYARLREAEHRQTLSEERQRLTQDMHDGLGSSLVSALRVVESGRMSDAELADVLKSCIDDLKLTIDSMEPVEADLLLLLATLRFRISPRITSTGMALRWEVGNVPRLEWLDQRNALHVLRILQEAFTNILKHARASEIRVITASTPGWVSVTLQDNGVGFDVNAERPALGKGLANQQRRATAIGARVEIVSFSSGTALTLHLPETQGSDHLSV